MLTSLAYIFLVGLTLAALCQRAGLPRIIGMLLTGVVLGPYALNRLDSSVLSISADLRQMALIIILIKAGLALNLSDLRQVGRPAMLMSFVPALCGIGGCVLLGPALLGLTRLEAALLGAVLGAVSPAVVVLFVLVGAVVSILLTAPLGALGMDKTYRRLLHHQMPG